MKCNIARPDPIGRCLVLWIIFLGIYYLIFPQILADYPYVVFVLLGIVAFGSGPLFEKLESKNPKLIYIMM